MKKLGSAFLMGGVILIVGPFFGFSLRGMTDVSYPESLIGGIVFICIGSVCYVISNALSREKNINN